MAEQDLKRFQDVVLSDTALQQELRDCVERAAFIALVVQCGRERACLFTTNEVEAAMRTNQRAWLERGIR
jgi:Nif11 domain